MRDDASFNLADIVRFRISDRRIGAKQQVIMRFARSTRMEHAIKPVGV